MHTTKQVLEASGFKSVRTLQRWRERNLVPPPTLQRHPNGRGMTWVWPLWTIRHIAEIRKRLAAGETLDGVAKTLSGDWHVEEKKYFRKRPNFKEACERIERFDAIEQFSEWASEAVYDFLRAIGIERPGRIDFKISKAAAAPHFIDEALELIRQGYTPIMVISEDEVRVTPDFLLGSAFSKSDCGGCPVLVVPIRDALIEAFAKSQPNLPKDPMFLPPMQVAECNQGKTRMRKYRQQKQWEFSLEK